MYPRIKVCCQSLGHWEEGFGRERERKMEREKGRKKKKGGRRESERARAAYVGNGWKGLTAVTGKMEQPRW